MLVRGDRRGGGSRAVAKVGGAPRAPPLIAAAAPPAWRHAPGLPLRRARPARWAWRVSAAPLPVRRSPHQCPDSSIGRGCQNTVLPTHLVVQRLGETQVVLAQARAAYLQGPVVVLGGLVALAGVVQRERHAVQRVRRRRRGL